MRIKLNWFSNADWHVECYKGRNHKLVASMGSCIGVAYEKPLGRLMM